MLHVICTRLHPGHLSVCVGDSSRGREEIVKNLEQRLSMRLLLLLLLLPISEKGITRVSDQTGISRPYIIVEIYHSGWKQPIPDGDFNLFFDGKSVMSICSVVLLCYHYYMCMFVYKIE